MTSGGTIRVFLYSKPFRNPWTGGPSHSTTVGKHPYHGRVHLKLQPTFAPGSNQQDQSGRSQIHESQIRKDDGVVAPGEIQNIAA